ncbi:unnamed protein product [Cochlearia groenlandica]
MFVSDMERKTLAFTPSLLLLLFSSSVFHLRGAPFGSSKGFHGLLLLSCLLLSSVNTLHNLPEYDSFGSNIAPSSKVFQTFSGGDPDSVASIHNVCHSSHLLSSLSASGSEFKFDPKSPFFVLSCPNKSWSNSALISNNLSGVVWLSLKHVHIIEFHPFTGFFHMEETHCYKPLPKELYANKKNTRELSILVPGKQRGGDGIMEQNQCEGFSLQPGDSIKFLFFYQTKLSWESGVALLTVPMKATSPVLLFNLCKRPVFWVRTKKFLIAVLIAAALLILIFCFIDESNEGNNCSHITVEKFEKPSAITISPEMDSLLRSISKDTLQESNEGSMKPLASVSPSSSSQAETSEALNLTVNTAEEKKRRRNKKKKKKKGAISGLTSERTDVSSSHSGNSTPRSPLSPVPPTTQTTKKEVKPPPKPALSHSATFPVYGAKSKIIQGSCSLAPNVRAPGAKSRTQVKEEYRYDIWGDHLTGLNLMDRFKEVKEGKSSSSCFDGDECESFFVKGPQNLLTNSHASFVTFSNQWD